MENWQKNVFQMYNNLRRDIFPLTHWGCSAVHRIDRGCRLDRQPSWGHHGSRLKTPQQFFFWIAQTLICAKVAVLLPCCTYWSSSGHWSTHYPPFKNLCGPKWHMQSACLVFFTKKINYLQILPYYSCQNQQDSSKNTINKTTMEINSVDCIYAEQLKGNIYTYKKTNNKVNPL